MESYDNFLSDCECLSFIDHIKNINPTVDKRTGRNLEFYSIGSYDGFEFLDEKFKKIGIINKPAFNINRYEKGFFFLPHYDSGGENDRKSERIKTVIINLSKDDEYLGGNLFIDNKEIKTKQGTAFIFDSYKIHEVKIITKGFRYSLVTWLKKDNIKDKTLFEKSVI